ncbi:hypothetical protein ACLK19_21735 [Escherichia coli]
MGGTDSGDCCRRSGLCCGEVNRILALSLSWLFAHHRHIYWLYCRTGDHHCDNPRTLLMIPVCCMWAGFYLDILAGTNRNSYAWGLPVIPPDHCDHHSAGTIAYAGVRRQRCSEIVIGIVCAIMADLLFSPRSINKSGSRAGKFAGRAISINATLYEHGDGEVVDKPWANWCDAPRRYKAYCAQLVIWNLPAGRGPIDV